MQLFMQLANRAIPENRVKTAIRAIFLNRTAQNDDAAQNQLIVCENDNAELLAEKS
jgi:hypothetical protein